MGALLFWTFLGFATGGAIFEVVIRFMRLARADHGGGYHGHNPWGDGE